MSYEDAPKIDHSRYRYTAVVDWVEVSIKTQSATNFHTIKRHLDLSYVTPLDASSGGSASEFSFRIYDVSSWASIRLLFSAIDEQFGLVGQPLITGVEIAFDAYSKHGSDDDLILIAAHFYKSLAKPASNNRRLGSNAKNGFSSETWHRDILKHFKRGDTAYIGNKNDNISQRIYFKQTDQGANLSKNEHRARLEITLLHDGCPFKSLEQAERFALTKLAGWFKFRRIKDHLEGVSLKIAEEKAMLGVVGAVRRAEGGTRLHSKSTKADKILGDKAYDALRNLDRKLKRSVRKNRFADND